MPEPTIADILQKSAPIIVTAPTARNGITLVQRLLNSTGDIVVFGENTMLVSQLPRLAISASQVHAEAGPQHAASLARFIAEGGEYWSSDLWPPTEQFVGIALNALAQAVAVYERAARDAGRSLWGIKNPMTDVHMVERLRLVLPRAKFVFLYRDLIDVARSAKARRFVQSDADLAALAASWQTHVLRMVEMDDPRVMRLSYAELVGGPAEAIAKLEAFTGVSGIDQSIMGRKINTFRGAEGQGCSPTGYIAPATLTAGEITILETSAAAGLTRLRELASAR